MGPGRLPAPSCPWVGEVCDDEGMEDPETSFFRHQLLERRRRLRKGLERAQPSPELHPLLEQVDRALQHLEEGTYGLCETCQDPIEKDRLMADPLIRFCLDHLSDTEQAALEADLSLAHEVQQSLLPKPALWVATWDLAYSYQAAGAVGGDYCDVIGLDAEETRFAFLLGDVSGKGVSASMLMAYLHALFRTLSLHDLPAGRLLERANHLFCNSTLSSQFATLVCVMAEVSSGEVQVSNAGHLPPLLAREGRVEAVESGGFPLGVFCNSRYPQETLQLGQKDSLLLYTDGVVETRNGSGEDYGMERLKETFGRASGGSAQEGISALLEELTAFAGSAAPADDRTLMMIRPRV